MCVSNVTQYALHVKETLSGYILSMQHLLSKFKTQLVHEFSQKMDNLGTIKTENKTKQLYLGPQPPK